MSWEVRTLPGGRLGLPSTGAKHLRLAHCPRDGRIWINGGDYIGTTADMDSGRQEMWSYGVADNSWRLEQPYCLPAGQVQPMHPDETGFCWDDRRGWFWLVPGYQGGYSGECVGKATALRNRLMSYDPATKLWTDRGPSPGNVLGLGDTPKFFRHDPMTDALIGFGPGPSVLAYEIEPARWSMIRLAVGGNPLEELSAVDWLARRLYGLDATLARIYEWDLDGQRLIRTFPVATMTSLDNRIGITPFVWAPSAQALLVFEHHGTRQLHIWQGGRWRAEALPLIDGVKPKGNCGVWDPALNVFLITGGLNPTRLCLYRFDGSVTIPVIQGIQVRVS